MSNRHICMCCGKPVMKSAFSDPYLCRYCEHDLEKGADMSRFGYMDGSIW